MPSMNTIKSLSPLSSPNPHLTCIIQLRIIQNLNHEGIKAKEMAIKIVFLNAEFRAMDRRNIDF